MDEEDKYTCNDCENFDGVTCDFNGLRRYPDVDPGYGCEWKGFVKNERRNKGIGVEG